MVLWVKNGNMLDICLQMNTTAKNHKKDRNTQTQINLQYQQFSFLIAKDCLLALFNLDQ